MYTTSTQHIHRRFARLEDAEGEQARECQRHEREDGADGVETRAAVDEGEREGCHRDRGRDVADEWDGQRHDDAEHDHEQRRHAPAVDAQWAAFAGQRRDETVEAAHPLGKAGGGHVGAGDAGGQLHLVATHEPEERGEAEQESRDRGNARHHGNAHGQGEREQDRRVGGGPERVEHFGERDLALAPRAQGIGEALKGLVRRVI